MAQEERDVDPQVVRALLLEQAPDLAGLPLGLSEASGSSNVVVRLGRELAVRLPRSDAYAEDLVKETTWLPHLGPRLPASVPEVVLAGRPVDVFPRPWSVVRWVPGETPGELDPDQQLALATTLGAFLRSLHAVETEGLAPGAAWGYRCGEPVTEQSDAWVEEAAVELADLFDPVQVRRAWRVLRDVPAGGPPCWVHTDLSAENLLVHPDGRLAGVIDFGGVGVGEAAVDLLYAWSLLDPPARAVLGEHAEADPGTWARARAWAFAGPGLLTIAGYRESLPRRTAVLTAMVEAVAAEVGVRLR